jgi:hypothetical protein
MTLSVLTTRNVEDEKELGNYRRAGQIRALLGLDRYYGCHYGMRSSLDLAKTAFTLGYNEVHFYLTNGNV